MACCKGCAKAAKLGKMAKRRSSGKSGVIEVAKVGAGIAGGIVVGKLVVANLPFLKGNPLFAGGAQLALATILAGMAKGSSISYGISGGMAANGIVAVLLATAPDLAGKLGISGLGGIERPYELGTGSTIMPGVAGMRLNGMPGGIDITVQ